MAHLENRGNGSWRIIISLGYDAQGKKQMHREAYKVDPSHTIGSQRREVEKHAAILQADLQRGLLEASRKVTVAAFIEEYLDDRRRAGLAASTLKQYGDILHGRVEELLGKATIQDLKPRDIARFYKLLAQDKPRSNRSKGLSGTYLHSYATQLHAMLGLAVRHGLIAVNPCDRVSPPKKDTKEASYLTVEEAGRVLAALEKLDNLQMRLFFTMMLYLGMRPGELIGLNWSDISGDTLHIRAGAFRPKGQHTQRTAAPKTPGSRRDILLAPELQALLHAHRTQQLTARMALGDSWQDAIFCTLEGARMDINTPTHTWRKFIKRNGLPAVNLYALRHTAASLALEHTPLKEVSALLGHSQASTTANVYAHVLREKNARAAANIADTLHQAKGE